MTWMEATRSQGRSRLPSLAGMYRQASGKAISTIGTLTRNTEPHQKCSSSAPPSTGPKAAPPEATEAQMPMARARSFSSQKLSRISDSVAGIIMAAPTPSSARAAISMPALGAKAAASEAPPNTARPAMNRRLWPRRSPSVPMPSSRPETTRE
ncbi:hypothetical protein D3C72_989500 [compost metagenome]